MMTLSSNIIVHICTDQDTLNCTLVVSIEDADFLSILCIPDVNSTVRWTTEENDVNFLTQRSD